MTIERLREIHEDIWEKVDKFINNILAETEEVDDIDSFVANKRLLVKKEIDRLVAELPDEV